MSASVTGLSSMATKGFLAELAVSFPGRATMEATGGVDAARRVRGGEAVDVVVLADAVMRTLEAEGLIVSGSLKGIALSSIAVAVRAGTEIPSLVDESALRRAILGTGRIGYSTGPSGDHLLRLLGRWGLLEELGDRLVQAPPGTAVGSLLAAGVVDLAVQQRSELMDVDGTVIAGPLPPAAASDTVFSAGLATSSPRPATARAFIAYLASPDTAAVKRRHGMESISEL